MTLLEALLATVILSVVALACLEGTRGAARLQQRSGAVAASVMHAESELARAVLRESPTPGTVVRRVPYGPANGRLELLEVEIEVAGGGRTRLTTLVERPAAAGSR